MFEVLTVCGRSLGDWVNGTLHDAADDSLAALPVVNTVTLREIRPDCRQALMRLQRLS